MKDYNRMFRKTAVLGAGVMGAQIAAQLANTGVQVVLFDLPSKEGNKNDIVNRALKGLTKLRPSPLAAKSTLDGIRPANYEQHLELLKDCDLVIESISEKIEWKHDLYKKIISFLKKDAILTSNTSGISISKLAEVLTEEVKPRFCGTHFFNPPRYLYMVELIPHTGTDPMILDVLESFLTTTMGKGVIRAKDTPGFISNRVGSFSLNAVFYHTERLGLPFDLVDKLTGLGIGRAKSATYRTADIVGLDTIALVTEKSLAANLEDDPWHKFILVPAWMQALIDKGVLGQKTGAGIYKKVGKDILVIDLETQDYRPVRDDVDNEVNKILRIRDWREKFDAIKECKSTQGDFLLSIFRDLFHYGAVHLSEIAHCARDVDLALRWGFGWTLGPFEIWQAAGWRETTDMLVDDIQAGRTMSDPPLPDWVLEEGRTGVHQPEGSWSPSEKTLIPRSDHPVYKRQLFPDFVLGEKPRRTESVFETDDVRMWHTNDELAVLSFKTKMNTVNEGVMDGIFQAIEKTEKDFKALVLWQPAGPFSAGANLDAIMKEVQEGNYDLMDEMTSRFQKVNMALRYSCIPTVAAVQGMVLGGGCEMMIHCDRIVAALETYAGFVEVSIGLIPAGGGTKEMVLRAAEDAKGGEIFPHLARYYEQVATGKYSGSALEAREMGYLRQGDLIIPNKHEILHVAKREAEALYEAGYRPPNPAKDIPVVGRTGRATLQAMLVNFYKGNFISEHDYLIGSRLATLFSGGEIDAGHRVNDQWLLSLERDVFMELLRKEKTHERIQHMLEKGKPLRN
ncbi:MAG: 3-hydroxyacyl-CoA dehydrogenase/enoyl-CoA hydratase family protein [Candidatus Aminicenantes bacterium]|nr:MAG: 3-hydroxyacyl-CoA dehydrogenase/enoyl-CoA hydratase family protein [Candidatus Aminicenantes bacterium]